MGFFDRLFGHHPAQDQGNANAQPAQQPAAPTQTIPIERMGLNGEYDQSGLAKRVAKAFDDDTRVDDHGHIWIAQHNTTVVLKGKIASQEDLKILVGIAKGVKGTENVDTTAVEIGKV